MVLDLAAQREVVLATATRLTKARQIYREGIDYFRLDQYERAASCIKQAAEMGDAQAQDHAGCLYEAGFLGEPDYDQAFAWYRKAAEQCFPNACFHVGICYNLGQGVAEDWNEAARWFEKAAHLGHVEAKNALEMLRSIGSGGSEAQSGIQK